MPKKHDFNWSRRQWKKYTSLRGHLYQGLQRFLSFLEGKSLGPHSGQDYYLGGASFGATVAFEMARQLLLKGKKIAFLGLFDGWTHYPRDILEKSSVQLTKFNEKANESPHDKKIIYLNLLEKDRKVLLNNYKLSPIKTDAVLFKAKSLWPSFIDIQSPDNGWISYLRGELTIYEIPGDHETMFFNPHIKTLAMLLNIHLNKVYKLSGCLPKLIRKTMVDPMPRRLLK